MARIERYGNGETAMQPNDTESAKRTLRRTRNNHPSSDDTVRMAETSGFFTPSDIINRFIEFRHNLNDLEREKKPWIFICSVGMWSEEGLQEYRIPKKHLKADPISANDLFPLIILEAGGVPLPNDAIDESKLVTGEKLLAWIRTAYPDVKCPNGHTLRPDFTCEICEQEAAQRFREHESQFITVFAEDLLSGEIELKEDIEREKSHEEKSFDDEAERIARHYRHIRHIDPLNYEEHEDERLKIEGFSFQDIWKLLRYEAIDEAGKRWWASNPVASSQYDEIISKENSKLEQLGIERKQIEEQIDNLGALAIAKRLKLKSNIKRLNGALQERQQRKEAIEKVKYSDTEERKVTRCPLDKKFIDDLREIGIEIDV